MLQDSPVYIYKGEKMIKIKPETAKKVYELVRGECCNCFDDCCIMLDDGEETCPQLLSISRVCCRYFTTAVLPGNPELYREIMETGKKHCKQCDKLYTPRSKNQQYCNVCGEMLKKEKARDRQRRFRAAL